LTASGRSSLSGLLRSLLPARRFRDPDLVFTTTMSFRRRRRIVLHLFPLKGQLKNR